MVSNGRIRGRPAQCADRGAVMEGRVPSRPLAAGKPKWPGWYPALHEPWRQRVVSGASQRNGKNAELLRGFSGSHCGACWRAGVQGCADRRLSGMTTASLQGRTCSVSARPCTTARPYQDLQQRGLTVPHGRFTPICEEPELAMSGAGMKSRDHRLGVSAGRQPAQLFFANMPQVIAE